MTTKRQIVLPADVYDALEFSVMEYGIGANTLFACDDNDAIGVPVCLFGHAYFLAADYDGNDAMREILAPFYKHGVYPAFSNDDAIADALGYEDRYDIPAGARLTWEQYCKARNIVRADT
jgi:hypothetical protein